MMGKLWVCMLVLSFFCAILFGKTSELSSSVLGGAEASVELCISISGLILLWSGVMEIMKKSGLMDKIAKIITPVIGFLFPKAKKDKQIMADISANVSANLLGLGNAATPPGIRAAEGLHRLSGKNSASDDMCMLVVINTASLQLIPTTIGAIRASCGASVPFDIIPAIWVASIISLVAGVFSAKLMARFYRR
ncbi:MAG: spore maturation protein A [Clostridia bacterium]|nr:spore maturation protein A [Clostridia bacterium]